ncbi:DUF3293 domain-containing protein [Vibrio sp. Of7-15]|uniref:DUF3293 domain-containing protein n=1 Tax=Vibrio sp. Of7-15 TaxID=2724879 RepID=UPI001EF382D9|nr:DUF3293 domain-containing protein [Vibrio sp. Of7-15]MCG7497616.1 DUF3293 domain-containing protein [Vibrio sp. Of7-15]
MSVIEQDKLKCKRELWGHYSSTVFYVDEPPSIECFAIITGWNPRSVKKPDERNFFYNQKLMQEMKSRSLRFSKIVGSDREGRWFEDSFAVEVPLLEAVELAKQFDQNAIYYVECGRIRLVPVLLGGQSVRDLGLFSELLIIG